MWKFTSMRNSNGFNINIKDKFDIFCEYQAGYILTINRNDYGSIKNIFEKNQIEYQNIGEVSKESIEINSKKFDYFKILNDYLNNFEKIIN